MKTSVCPACGRDFRPWTTSQRCCSQACRSAYAKDHPTTRPEAVKRKIAASRIGLKWTEEQRARHRERHPWPTCAICDKPFKRGNPGQRTCSRTCMGEWNRRHPETVRRTITPAQRRATSERMRGKVGPESIAWSGGVQAHGDGRIKVWTPDGYEFRYRVVWTDAYPDDPILPREHIHHINGDRTDDRLENLVKLSPTNHATLHGKNKRPETLAKHAAAARARPRDDKGRFRPASKS